MPQIAEKILENIKGRDPGIRNLIRKKDERRLASSLETRYKTSLQKIAGAMRIPEEEIGYISARYLMGDDMAFKNGFNKEGMGPDDFRPQDDAFEKFRKYVSSDKTAQKYIKKRDSYDLESYLRKRYYKYLAGVSKKWRRPLRDVAREFSERLIHEREDEVF